MNTIMHNGQLLRVDWPNVAAYVVENNTKRGDVFTRESWVDDVIYTEACKKALEAGVPYDNQGDVLYVLQNERFKTLSESAKMNDIKNPWEPREGELFYVEGVTKIGYQYLAGIYWNWKDCSKENYEKFKLNNHIVREVCVLVTL